MVTVSYKICLVGIFVGNGRRFWDDWKQDMTYFISTKMKKVDYWSQSGLGQSAKTSVPKAFFFFAKIE